MPKNRGAAEAPKPKDLHSEIEAVKAENAAVRELLRKMEGQQRILLEQVERLQRRLDGGTATDVSMVSQPIVPPTTAGAAVAADAALNTRSRCQIQEVLPNSRYPLPPHHRQMTSVTEMEWSSGNLAKARRCRSC